MRPDDKAVPELSVFISRKLPFIPPRMMTVNFGVANTEKASTYLLLVFGLQLHEHPRAGQAVAHDQCHQSDVREDASEKLPRHAQTRDAFAPRRGLLLLKATCWHFSFHLTFTHFRDSTHNDLFSIFSLLLSYFRFNAYAKCGETWSIFSYQPSAVSESNRRRRVYVRNSVIEFLFTPLDTFGLEVLVPSNCKSNSA